MDFICERLSLLEKIKRKYGNTLEEVYNTYEKLSNELSSIEVSQDELLETEKEIKFYKKHYAYDNKKTWKYNDIVFKNKKPIYFRGYYSHYKYWIEAEEKLQKNLDFSHWILDDANKKMKQKIEKQYEKVSYHHPRSGSDYGYEHLCFRSRGNHPDHQWR